MVGLCNSSKVPRLRAFGFIGFSSTEGSKPPKLLVVDWSSVGICKASTEGETEGVVGVAEVTSSLSSKVSGHSHSDDSKSISFESIFLSGNKKIQNKRR